MRVVSDLGPQVRTSLTVHWFRHDSYKSTSERENQLVETPAEIQVEYDLYY